MTPHDPDVHKRSRFGVRAASTPVLRPSDTCARSASPSSRKTTIGYIGKRRLQRTPPRTGRVPASMRTASLIAAALLLAPLGARAESHPLGVPWAGALANGVQLPASGEHYFTWDPVLRRAPNRPWRRYGTERLVRLLVRIVDSYAAAHRSAPRVGIGDLSRPRGGDFGIRYGRPGHVSHQNGLDADVFYPRR